MKRILYLLLLVCGNMAVWAQPQFTPVVNRNAALQYWMAFGSLKDRAADSGVNKSIDDVLAGTTPWDEQHLGPIVQENTDAIQIMQRGSHLPECEWGLEYGRGAATSLGHLPKARVLARLNALYGARQLSTGDVSGAVDTWLSGLRFSQCMAKGIGLIGALSARPALVANLHLLGRAVQSGALSADAKTKVGAQLRHLPPEGIDWIASIAAESWACEEGLRYLAKAQDFQSTYKEFYSTPPLQPAHPPTDSEIAAFHSLMNEVEAAFQLPYPQTQERLNKILPQVDNMNPAVQSIIPNFRKLNDTRHGVELEMETLNKAVGGK